MRYLLILVLVAGCAERPDVDWPLGPQPATPQLLASQPAPAETRADPGPGVAARGAELRAWALAGPADVALQP